MSVSRNDFAETKKRPRIVLQDAFGVRVAFELNESKTAVNVLMGETIDLNFFDLNHKGWCELVPDDIDALILALKEASRVILS